MTRGLGRLVIGALSGESDNGIHGYINLSFFK